MEQGQPRSIGEVLKPAEKTEKSSDFEAKHTSSPSNSQIVSQEYNLDYNLEKDVSLLSKSVDNPPLALETSPDGAVRNINLSDETVNVSEGSRQLPSAEGRSSDSVPVKEEMPPETSALASQLERMDWAAVSLPGQNTYSGQEAPPVPSVAAGRGLSLPAGPELTDSVRIPSALTPASGGELEWAEQADRAFRRDNRRYDGGFYLY